MMRRIFATFALLIFAFSASFAQNNGFVVDIWPDGLPNTNGVDLTKPYDDATQNYKPQITVYLPKSQRPPDRLCSVFPAADTVWFATTPRDIIGRPISLITE